MPRHGTDADDESADLRQDYQNAVDCLIQCETLFNSFHEQLQLKDERIITLEDKVMELSLELAAIKAHQDVPNLKANESGNQQTRPSACSGSGGFRRKSWTSWAIDNPNNDTLRLPNFGHLINRSLNWLETKHAAMNDGAGVVQVEFPKDTNDPKETGSGDLGPTIGDKMLRRHTTNLKKRSSGSLHLERPLRRSRSSASSGMTGLTLEGVVFPVSSFEVYSKGCRVGRTKKTDMRNSEWPEF